MNRISRLPLRQKCWFVFRIIVYMCKGERCRDMKVSQNDTNYAPYMGGLSTVGKVNLSTKFEVSISTTKGGAKLRQELIRRWDSQRELLLRRYLTRTSKYSLLLNIQHDAGCRQTRQRRREWAWPRGITVRRFSHPRICCNEVSLKSFFPNIT